MSAALGGRSLSPDATSVHTAADQGRRRVQSVGIGPRATEPGAAHPGLVAFRSGIWTGLELADVAVEVAGIVPVEVVVQAVVGTVEVPVIDRVLDVREVRLGRGVVQAVAGVVEAGIVEAVV